MSSCLFRGGIKSRANSITVQMSHWDPFTSDLQTVAPCSPFQRELLVIRLSGARNKHTCRAWKMVHVPKLTHFLHRKDSSLLLTACLFFRINHLMDHTQQISKGGVRKLLLGADSLRVKGDIGLKQTQQFKIPVLVVIYGCDKLFLCTDYCYWFWWRQLWNMDQINQKHCGNKGVLAYVCLWRDVTQV